MTFTIVARCRASGQAGVALATVSIAAGGLCPFYTQGGDIVVSQAYAHRLTGHRLAQALEKAAPRRAAFDEAVATAPHAGYRQILLLARDGTTLAHSGPDCRPWAGHLVEDDVIVAGNVLAGAIVVESMLAAFKSSAGKPLAERLLAALESGRDAGGQAGPGGVMLSERSAMLRVLGSGEAAGCPELDLRVDLDNSAVHALRDLHRIHATYDGYSQRRESDPPNSGSIVAFEAEHLRTDPAFGRRPSVYR